MARLVAMSSSCDSGEVSDAGFSAIAPPEDPDVLAQLAKLFGRAARKRLPRVSNPLTVANPKVSCHLAATARRS